jgi:hypothetical protein
MNLKIVIRLRQCKELSSFPKLSIVVLGPTQLPLKWISAVGFNGGKAAGA